METVGKYKKTVENLPIIHLDLPIPTRSLNSSAKPEFLNPMFDMKIQQIRYYPFLIPFC